MYVSCSHWRIPFTPVRSTRRARRSLSSCSLSCMGHSLFVRGVKPVTKTAAAKVATAAASCYRREATAGIEPAVRVLQTPALPLGYVARQKRGLTVIARPSPLERATRLELVTFSLARRRSTTELCPQVDWHYIAEWLRVQEFRATFLANSPDFVSVTDTRLPSSAGARAGAGWPCRAAPECRATARRPSSGRPG